MHKISIVVVALFVAGCGPKPSPEQHPAADQNTVKTAAPIAASAPFQIPDKLQPCVKAMLNTKLQIKKWEAGLIANCGSLNAKEQKAAADAATELSGTVETSGIALPRLQFWKTASEAIGIFAKGDLPYHVQALSEDEEWLAQQGNYQAQRNYAYSLSQRNPIAACAWRIVIIQQGHKRVDTTDTGNLKVYCGKLDQVEIAAAENQSKQLLKEISKNAPQ